MLWVMRFFICIAPGTPVDDDFENFQVDTHTGAAK